MSIYYSNGNLLSYRAFFNLTIGARGTGKTYNFKGWSIDDAIKNGRQFVWLRRFGTEIDIMRKDFFKDIADKYPAYKFEIKGNRKKGTFYCDGKIIGYYFALSTSSIAKSSSYPLVDKIIFDEFLIVGKTYHYLDDEVTLLLEFIETIFRNREYQENVVKPRGVYLIGNNVTIANPYFLYFNIPPFKQRFFQNKERGLLVEMYNSTPEFMKQKANSNIGKLTKGTAYYDYAIENEAYLDNDRFIAKKPANTTFYCAIDYKGKTYGFWLDYKNGNMYVNNQFDPYSYNHYSLTKDDHSINTFLIKNLKNTYIKNIVWLFRDGSMFFDNNQTKAQVYEILSFFVR